MNKTWFRLDNAALIFPAIMNSSWSNGFRLSFNLNEDVDPIILQEALNSLKDRFPSFFVRLKSGIFWYYLEENINEVKVISDYAYPLTFMSRTQVKKSCIRVLYYKNRVAVEFFHSVTDGNGGLIFVKNLAAQYLRLKYKINIPNEYDVFDIDSRPLVDELVDGFNRCCGKYAASRNETNSFHIKGTIEYPKFNHIITGILNTNKLLDLAHSYNATVTEFLSGVMIESFVKYQSSIKPFNKQKDVKVTIPVNLRKLYGIKTLRNFVLVTNVGIDPKTGDYCLQEIIDQVKYQLKTNISRQKMSSNIAANVMPSRNVLMKLAPLPLKSFVMSLVYKNVGESKGCLNISNVGDVKIPEIMKQYINRFEFIISPPLYYPDNCSLCSYNNHTYISLIRRIKESDIERLFYSRLVDLGLEVLIESNTKGE